MTGFDGLVQAHQRNVQARLNTVSVPFVAGSGQASRKDQTWFESTMHKLGMPEEIIAKAIGSLVSNDPKYSFGRSSNYYTQVTFADLFRDAGVDPILAAGLGITAAIANPLDPLNKVKILGTTKLGKAAEAIQGRKLVKGSDGYSRLSRQLINKELSSLRKAIESGSLTKDNLRLAKASEKQLLRVEKEQGALNDLLVDLQKKGVDVENLRMGDSMYEQIRQGQRHLLGFSSPFAMDQLAFLGIGRGVKEASVAPVLPTKTAAAITKGMSNFSGALTGAVADTAYKLADKLNIPTTGRSVVARKASSALSQAAMKGHVRGQKLEVELQNILERYIKEAEEAGLTKGQIVREIQEIVQASELRSGVKTMLLSELEKSAHRRPVYFHGTDVSVQELDPDKAGGFVWFSDSEAIAGEYAKQRAGVGTGKVFEASLDTRSPLDLTKTEDVEVLSSLDPAYSKAGATEADKAAAARIIKRAKPDNIYLWTETKEARYSDAWRKVIIPQLKDKGYDSIFMRDAADTGNSIAVFDKAQIRKVPPPSGPDVTRGGKLKGLSPEEKEHLTQTGLTESELPVAVKQFKEANTPVIRTGRQKQHEMRMTGRFVVVKTNDPKAIVKAQEGRLADLDGIYGQRVWATYTDETGTYLVQRRMPSAQRVVRKDDFQIAHLKNLSNIAAQLSRQKKALTDITAADILVSPSGAVQIVNPSVIEDVKSAKDAVTNSRVALEALASDMDFPKGTIRELQVLKNTKTAKAVPRGVDGFTFRSVGTEITDEVIDKSAHDLLEEAVNTDGFKDIVRASYDELTPTQVAQAIGDPRDFERANEIEYYRKQIQQAIAEGREPLLDPIAVTVDDAGNLWIANGRARLTAALLEGYDTVPVYRRNFIGEIKDIEKGYYVGSTYRLGMLWNPIDDSSAINLDPKTSRVVASNYSLIGADKEVVKLKSADMHVDDAMPSTFERLITLGAVFADRQMRAMRLTSVTSILEQKYGSMRNAFVEMAEIAEASPDAQSFVKGLEGMLDNQISLDNTARHIAEREDLYNRLRNASTRTLDGLASRGFLSPNQLNNLDRIGLATKKVDGSLMVMDAEHSTLRLYSDSEPNGRLMELAEGFINKTTTPADVEPYARIEAVGSNGTLRREVKDLVKDGHPKLTQAIEPVKKFVISEEHADALRKAGIVIVDDKHLAKSKEALAKKGLQFGEEGRGVLLKDKRTPIRDPKGRYSSLDKERTVVRPQFSFFMTRSGTLLVGTKHKNVKDLLEAVFEEGPAYFEELGVMTSGRVVVSNVLGSRVEKIGVAEMRQLQTRLQELAKKFRSMGLSDSTVLDVHMPFDNAVWRAIYGERVTISDVLSDKFKLAIPDDILNHTPDLRVLASGRMSMDSPVGVVALERTRLANQRMQKLFEELRNYGDELFLDAAKQGLPVQYYESWFGRHLTQSAREALNEAWLKFPNKESKTFKHVESFLKGRVITDLTTLELNEVIKRLQKEGIDNPHSIISQVVAEFRKGYELKPNPKTASALVALSKMLPEGVDFFYVDPIYATALAGRQVSRAITRDEIVKSLKDLGVALWHGSPEELRAAKVTRARKATEFDNVIATTREELEQAQRDLARLNRTSPDVDGGEVEVLRDRITKLTNKLADTEGDYVKFLNDKLGKGKVMDNMVDLEAQEVWVRGSDIQKLVNDGLVNPSDFRGDIGDAFVRVPIGKYESVLSGKNAEIFLFPKEVAGVVRKFFGAQSKEGFGKFLALWDQVHSLWRSWTLFPIPAYHVRNGISNVFMAYLGGVDTVHSYQGAHNMLNVMRAFQKGKLTKREVQEALGAMKFASANGQVVTGKDLWSAFVHHGGLAGGLHHNEFTSFGSLARASEFEVATTRAGLRPSSEAVGSWLYDNAAIRGGVSFAAAIENRSRLAVFIDSFVKGRVETHAGQTLSGFDAAALHMKRVFYDYSDLSAFERSVMRRVLPFYSWSRHNIPRMLKTMLTDPVKHYRMHEMFFNLEMGLTDHESVREKELPQWVREKFGLMVSKTDKGHWVVKTGDGLLPMYDAYRIFGGSGFFEMFKEGLTPFVKTPIEQLTNYSLYSGRDIEKYPGERSRSGVLGAVGFSRRATTEGPLGIANLLLNESNFRTFFRVGSEVEGKLLPLMNNIFDAKESDSWKMHMMALLIGRAYTIDPVQARAQLYRDWSTQYKKFVRIRDNAASRGDMRVAEDMDRMLTWLTLHQPEGETL